MARTGGSWLDGPGGGVPGGGRPSANGAGGRPSANGAGGRPSADGPTAYPGERLGRPQIGPGSVAGFGRRLGALVIDWVVALLIATPATGHRPFTPGSNSPWTLAVVAAEYIVLVPTLGSTIGMRLLGIAVTRLDGRRMPFGWTVVRTFLLVIVVPAVIYDRDQRGLHDKASGAVVVRT